MIIISRNLRTTAILQTMLKKQQMPSNSYIQRRSSVPWPWSAVHFAACTTRDSAVSSAGRGKAKVM